LEELTRAYSNLGCKISMKLLVELYLACLAPIISYGCEIWAFKSFQGKQSASVRSRPSSAPLLEAHKRVLTQILGVRLTTPEAILNWELHIHSLWSTWILCVVRFWNNIASMKPDTIDYKVLLQNLRLVLLKGRGTLMQQHFAGTLMHRMHICGHTNATAQ
jgi:hypothetical protein